MTDYSKLSDMEISCEVGRAISFADYLLARNEQKKYCNSWADAGPIAAENKIAIYPRKDGGWIAQGFENCIAVIDDNPCRAICIVFLMMNEGE